MKGNKILINVLAFLVMVAVVFAAVFIVTGSMMEKREGGKAEKAKTVIIPASDKFQTNLKGTGAFFHEHLFGSGRG